MQKPTDLRTAITAAYPEFARDPDRLTMWVEDGRVRSPMTANRGFTCEYTLNITVVAMTTDPGVLFLAINDWCRTNQPDLLTALPNAGYSFEADLIDRQTIDLHITLKLTEQIALVADGSGLALQSVPEPDMAWLTGDDALTSPPVNLTTVIPAEGTPPA
jgi:hypothetical protein